MLRRRKSADLTGSIRTGSLLVVGFAFLILVSRTLLPDALGYSAIFPANAAIAVAVLMLPARLTITALCACFAANVVLDLLFIHATPDVPMRQLLNIATGTVTALLVRRFCGAGVNLLRLRRLAAFAAIVFGVSACEPVMDELVFSGRPLLGAVLADTLFWTLEDGLGLLIGIPAILAILRGLDDGEVGAAGSVERWALLLLISVAAALVFAFPLFFPLFLVPSLLIALAFRAGPGVVFASILLIAMIGAALTAHGYGPIAALDWTGPLRREMLLQFYLVSLFLVAVPTGAALRSRGIALRRLQRLKDSLQRTALRDPLTRLANRRAFQDRLETHLRSGADGTVLFVDLDRFKEVNDTLGHQAGDTLLLLFARRLREVLDSCDALTARFGGDEFVMLLPGTRRFEEVGRLCTDLLQAARRPYALAGTEIHVSVCIGAVEQAGTRDALELMRRADLALYAAKQGGRDTFRIFHAALDRGLRSNRALEEALRRALAEETGLALHYQPKLDRENRLAGVEALLRWTHPEQGLIPADRAIEVAENSGLIVPLGNWILHEAVAFARRWPGLCVAINVSPMQLEQPEFARDVLRVAGSAPGVPGTPSVPLEIEITEMALFRENGHAHDNLLALKRAGFAIALDDFGTGYSSFSRLRRFRIDRLKIDKSFVQGLDGESGAEAIIRAIVQLGHAMALQVTAEGVETEDHRRFLLESGVDELQGYLLARPMPEGALAGFIAPLLASSPGPA